MVFLLPFGKTFNPIEKSEYQQRIQSAQSIMRQKGISALYINAGTNLFYFTGMKWYASERMVGAIQPVKGSIQYIAPHFELGTMDGLKAHSDLFIIFYPFNRSIIRQFYNERFCVQWP